MRIVLLLAAALATLSSCQKATDTPTEPLLIFKFRFDSTQARLTNTATPAGLPAGRAGQSPKFNKMSAHYIELAPGALTLLGSGQVLYRAPETTAGGTNAIDFDRSVLAGNEEVFFSVPLRQVTPGEYAWLRLSLAYQNFDVKVFVDTVVNGLTVRQEFPGTAAGFIGFNTYIRSFSIRNQPVAVNGNRRQGFWGFETALTIGGVTIPFSTTGQAPEGATTVVNPLFNTSPVPAGSCVVTGAFEPGKLTITGTEKTNKVVTVSLSTNKSFEWNEVVADGRWEPGKGETVQDMGIRGMIPRVQ
jgi:hypothetical protein